MPFEFTVLDWIQAHLRSGAGDAFWPAVTSLGNGGGFWIALGLVLLALPRTRRLGLLVLTALALEAALCNLCLKPLVARVRPYDIKTAVLLLIAKPHDFSFPSGHTSASFAAASALCCGKSRLFGPALLLACCIAFSRLYLYVHFPTDVLGGMLLGLAAGPVAAALIEKIQKKLAESKLPKQ